jgi:hypothetical protein
MRLTSPQRILEYVISKGFDKERVLVISRSKGLNSTPHFVYVTASGKLKGIDLSPGKSLMSIKKEEIDTSLDEAMLDYKYN